MTLIKEFLERSSGNDVYRYEIESQVFFVKSNKVQSARVDGIFIKRSLDEQSNICRSIEYELNGEQKLTEDVLYPSKETLLNMLRGKEIIISAKHTFTPKKQLRDSVWLMHNDKVAEGTVHSIDYRKFVNSINYNIDEVELYEIYVDGKSVGKHNLNELFATKEDLIASL